ncbi:MAG: hypothetical protein IID61_01165 [SAR324 cluster bacterium]|nr:hypothetical protein [SAR324 cluster bacterium]
MAVETPEQVVVVDLDAALELAVFGNSGAGASHFVFKQVGYGDEFNAGIGLEALAHCAVAASAAAQQTNLDLAGALGVGHLCHRGGCGCDAGNTGCVVSRFSCLFIF